MKKIPWKGVALGCLAMALLVVARSVVAVGKAFYYGYDWVPKLVEDPWFYVGIASAGLGIVALLILSGQTKQKQQEA